MYFINRKISFLFTLAMILSLVVGSGCKDDNGVEPQQNESLEGSWRLTTVIMRDTPVGDMTIQAAQFLEMSGTGATTSTMQFNEDGSAALITTYEEADDEVVPGTWSKDGDNLVIVGAGMDDTVPYAIAGNKLTLTIILPISFAPELPEEDTQIDMIYTKL